MTQRTIAALVAVPLLLALFAVAVFAPLPYATYAPGLTVDVLGEEGGEEGGEEIIQIDGHQSYRDEGQLRMTTVYVSLPKTRKGLVELVATWLDDDEAVYPYDAVHEKGETVEDSRRSGAIDMVTSQDRAVAVALDELGQDVESAVMVAYVEEGTPAEGKLEVRDLIVSVGGEDMATPGQVSRAVAATPKGEAVEIGVVRDGEERSVRILPERKDGTPRVGVTLGMGYRFPFEVDVSIDPDIGGPSAGLMFALAIYDTLTPGSLTGGGAVAGTGTIADDGSVGPIGGIQQKVAGARRDGAELFLVPAANCPDALGADAGDMRLVKATTMHQARLAVEAWAADPETDALPSCAD